MIVGITDEYSSDPAGLFRHLKLSTLDAGGTVALGIWALQRNKKILPGQCSYIPLRIPRVSSMCLQFSKCLDGNNTRQGLVEFL